MSITEAQAAVERLLRTHELGSDPSSRMLDLAAEVGELAKAFLETTAYGQHPFKRTPEWDEELGDVLFSVLGLSAMTGCDADRALDAAVEKVRDRLQRTGSASSGGSAAST